jgi:CO/xanthine dehydrogenase FAD-binding subunit
MCIPERRPAVESSEPLVSGTGYPRDVDVLLPSTLDEALEALAERPDARPIAGGTDMMVELNRGAAERPEAILDLSRVAELGRWPAGHGGGPAEREFLGAGVTYSRILAESRRDGALRQAARAVGSPQIRNRGTVGGNLGTASPAGDLLPVVAARDADVELVSATARRTVPWHAFLTGPKTTAIEPGELIAGVRWRRPDGPSVFAKVGPRNAMVISVCSVCVQVDEASGSVRVAMGSVGPTVLRAPDAEVFARDAIAEAGAWEDPTQPLEQDVAGRFGELVAGAVRPIDDVRGTATYRRHAVRVLAARALHRVLGERRER